MSLTDANGFFLTRTLSSELAFAFLYAETGTVFFFIVCPRTPLSSSSVWLSFAACARVFDVALLFFGRPRPAPDMINRQAVLCHRVLRTIQNVVVHSTMLDADTWECLLLFLLAINDSLLAPPTIPGSNSTPLEGPQTWS